MTRSRSRCAHLRDACSTHATRTVSGVSAIEFDRAIRLDGVFNFRDMGGYAATDGRSVRWRTLFRSDGLGRLTDDDVETLRPFGLRTVVDLRTPREIDERGRFPYEQY